MTGPLQSEVSAPIVTISYVHFTTPINLHSATAQQSPQGSLMEVHVCSGRDWKECCLIYCKRIYFRAAKFSRIKPKDAFSRNQIFAQKAVSSLCAILIYFFSLTSYFRAYKTMREMRENMYCAKISTFTVCSVTTHNRPFLPPCVVLLPSLMSLCPSPCPPPLCPSLCPPPPNLSLSLLY